MEQEINLIGNWAKLHFTENEGMAFGIEWGGSYGKLALTLFRIGACVLISLYLRKLIRLKANRGLIICIGLILAGAIGNILDSIFYGIIFTESDLYSGEAAKAFSGSGYAPIFYGHVVDMLYFPMIEFNWPGWVPFVGGDRFMFFRPIFNVADAAISIGVITILVFNKRYFKSLGSGELKVREEQMSEKNELAVADHSNQIPDAIVNPNDEEE